MRIRAVPSHLALLVLLAFPSCNRPAPQGEAVDLATCPKGDAAWRSAIGKSGAADDLAKLEVIARQAAEGCPERWEPRWAVGETLFRRSKFAEARGPFDEALTRARSDADPVGIACAANRIGSILYFKGELEPARALFEEALAAARRADRADLRAFVLNNLAGLLKERGELPVAAVLFDEAVTTLRELKLAKPARWAAYNAAVLRMNLGDFSGARSALEALQKDAADSGDAEVVGSASVALGNLLLTAGDHDGAFAQYQRATSESAQVALAREMGLGRVALARDDLREAEQRLAAAARLGREKELVLDALLAETWNAEVSIRQGRHREALDRLSQLEAEARKAESTQYALWLMHWQSGRAWRAAGNRPRAQSAFREAVVLLEKQTAVLSMEQEGLHFLMGRSDPYTDLADSLTRSERAADEVLTTMEQAHARRLRRAFGDRGVALAPASIATIQSSLAADELFVDYLIGRDRGVMLVVGPREARAVSIGGSAAIATALARWRAALVRPIEGSLAAIAQPEQDLARDADAGDALRRALLDPLGNSLRGVRRIWIVPDGDLALLPFASLPAAKPGRLVGEDLEFGLLPLAGAIPRPTPVSGPLLLAGRPTGGAGELGPLTRASRELDGIEAAWGASATQRLEGDAFLRKAFVELPLERFGTIHLATHALASSVDPRRCAVGFSNSETLGFDAIANLKLGGSLVVLSACRSGEGEVIPGQGVVGLAWAFFASGAREMVVSLWSVEDAAAAELMVELHTRLRAGDDTVHALAAAQSKLRRERPHPAYWAPFVVIARPGA